MIRYPHPQRTDVTPPLLDLLHADVPMEIGVSGAKESRADAFATISFLDEQGFTNRKTLYVKPFGYQFWKQRKTEKTGENNDFNKA